MLVGLLAVSALLAVIPAMLAARKGRSPTAFYLFGLVLFVPALIVVLLIEAEPWSVEAMLKRQSPGNSSNRSEHSP